MFLLCLYSCGLLECQTQRGKNNKCLQLKSIELPGSYWQTIYLNIVVSGVVCINNQLNSMYKCIWLSENNLIHNTFYTPYIRYIDRINSRTIQLTVTIWRTTIIMIHTKMLCMESHIPQKPYLGNSSQLLPYYNHLTLNGLTVILLNSGAFKILQIESIFTIWSQWIVLAQLLFITSQSCG